MSRAHNSPQEAWENLNEMDSSELESQFGGREIDWQSGLNVGRSTCKFLVEWPQ